MAFNFPNNPTEGLTFAPPGGPLYTFTNGVWTAAGQAALTVQDADVRYVNVSGDVMTGALGLVGDPTTALQPATKQYVDSLGGRLIGEVIDYAGATAPPKWLLCFGQAVSRTVYQQLFAVISTTYGAGDGTTTFNIPDGRGRASAGKDDMGGTNAQRLNTIASTTLGGTGGAQNHVLTLAQLASHNHGGVTSAETEDHTHTQTGTFTSGGISANHTHSFSDSASTTGGVSANHTHTFSDASSTTGGISQNHTHANTLNGRNFVEVVGGAGGQGTTGGGYGAVVNTNWNDRGHTHTVAVSGTTGANSVGHTHTVAVSGTTGYVSSDHTHNITLSGQTGGKSAGHTHSLTGAGNDAAHNNIQPVIIFNKLIFAGV